MHTAPLNFSKTSKNGNTFIRLWNRLCIRYYNVYLNWKNSDEPFPERGFGIFLYEGFC